MNASFEPLLWMIIFLINPHTVHMDVLLVGHVKLCVVLDSGKLYVG